MLSAVLVLVAVVLAIILVIVAVVLIVVLIAVLVHTLVILVVHDEILRFIYNFGKAVIIYCPVSYDLSLALKRILMIKPNRIAALIPPADAVRPPVKIPRNPILDTASRTPFAMVCPKPVSGTVAPAPEKSTSF